MNTKSFLIALSEVALFIAIAVTGYAAMDNGPIQAVEYNLIINSGAGL